MVLRGYPCMVLEANPGSTQCVRWCQRSNFGLCMQRMCPSTLDYLAGPSIVCFLRHYVVTRLLPLIYSVKILVLEYIEVICDYIASYVEYTSPFSLFYVFLCLWNLQGSVHQIRAESIQSAYISSVFV